MVQLRVERLQDADGATTLQALNSALPRRESLKVLFSGFLTIPDLMNHVLQLRNTQLQQLSVPFLKS